MSIRDKAQARKAQYQNNLAARREAVGNTMRTRYDAWDSETQAEMDAIAASRKQAGINSVKQGAANIKAKAPEKASDVIRAVLTDPRFASRVQDYNSQTQAQVNDAFNQSYNQAYQNYEAGKQAVRQDLIAKGKARYQANPELFQRILNNRGY